MEDCDASASAMMWIMTQHYWPLFDVAGGNKNENTFN